MNLARQALPGKGGNRYQVPEGRLKGRREGEAPPSHNYRVGGKYGSAEPRPPGIVARQEPRPPGIVARQEPRPPGADSVVPPGLGHAISASPAVPAGLNSCGPSRTEGDAFLFF